MLNTTSHTGDVYWSTIAFAAVVSLLATIYKKPVPHTHAPISSVRAFTVIFILSSAIAINSVIAPAKPRQPASTIEFHGVSFMHRPFALHKSAHASISSMPMYFLFLIFAFSIFESLFIARTGHLT